MKTIELICKYFELLVITRVEEITHHLVLACLRALRALEQLAMPSQDGVRVSIISLTKRPSFELMPICMYCFISSPNYFCGGRVCKSLVLQ